MAAAVGVMDQPFGIGGAAPQRHRQCVDDEGPWHTIEALELATLFWVDWYNTTRLHSSIEYLTPVAYEHAYWQKQTPETQTV